MISESTPSPDSITGATALGGASFSSNEDIFPQIVWLRGDEPYLESFCLDADAVMAELGIKRSRLTQISGRELRVGRMRIDRYVRPMYRREDVEAYKQWSRATATHQKSSLVLKEAASRLEEQGSLIEEKIQAASSDWTQHLASLINRQGENLRLTLETWKLETHQETSNVEERLQLLAQLMGEAEDHLATKLRDSSDASYQFSAEQFRLLNERWLKLHDQIIEVQGGHHALQILLNDKHTSLQSAIDAGFRDIQTSISQLAEVLTLIIHHQKDQSAKSEAILQKRLAEWSRELIEALSHQVPSTKSEVGAFNPTSNPQILIRNRRLSRR